MINKILGFIFGDIYKIAIMNNSTGEIRVCKIKKNWSDDEEFWWTEGNGSCDCNREIRFRISGNEKIIISVKCGDSAFSILYVKDRANEMICEFGEN